MQLINWSESNHKFLLFTFLANAENFRAWRVSSKADAHWLTFTIIDAFPFPQKNPWNNRVSLLSRNGMFFWLCLQDTGIYRNIKIVCTPDDFTHQWRASGQERVNWAYLPILFLNLSSPRPAKTFPFVILLCLTPLRQMILLVNGERLGKKGLINNAKIIA